MDGVAARGGRPGADVLPESWQTRQRRAGELGCRVVVGAGTWPVPSWTPRVRGGCGGVCHLGRPDCVPSLCPVVGKAERREGAGPIGWDPGRAVGGRGDSGPHGADQSAGPAASGA